MERSFGAMLRQLPGKTEVPNLLVDISQTGLAAGLQEKLFQPGSEKSNGFYAELPIKIRWWAAITSSALRQRHRGAAAHRDAARHQITPVDHWRKSGYDNLTMDVTAKTYRYIEDEGARIRPRRRRSREAPREKSQRNDAVCAPSAAFGAAGCSGGQSDLQKWIEATKKKPGGRIQPLPEVKPYETFVYSAMPSCARRSSREPEVRELPGQPAAEHAAQPRVPRGFLARHIEDGRHLQGRRQLLRAGAIQGRPGAQGAAGQLSRAERRQGYRNHR
jgi:hypothetical protein